jgi:hypothetical protein
VLAFPLGTPPGWTMFATIRVLSGDPPIPPLEDQIARVQSPTLLISAGESVERDFNVLYDTATPWRTPCPAPRSRAGEPGWRWWAARCR